MMRWEKRIRRAKPSSGRREPVSTSIIHHQSSFINPPGFTLIELLVVISILAVLTAILLPTLSRVRKHARAGACQANLRQWGILWATHAAEDAGHLPDRPAEARDGWSWWWGPEEGSRSRWYQATRDIMCCPMATKPANPTGQGSLIGGTFLAWGWGERAYNLWDRRSSYGASDWIGGWKITDSELRKLAWSSTDILNPAAVPAILDSAFPEIAWYVSHSEPVSPPAFDAIPTLPSSALKTPCCINRHNSHVNGLFLDWSVRKVGLKELWTLKWHKEYNTRGPWTKAGGVQPEDWPAWMRRFKDY